MILDFKILSLWFVIEYWWVRSNFATPSPFGSVSCFVVGVFLSTYNLNLFIIHQASYSKGYQWYLIHRETYQSVRGPLCLALILSFSTGIVWRHSPGRSRSNPKWLTSIYHVYISFGCHRTMLDQSKYLWQSNAKFDAKIRQAYLILHASFDL